MAKQKLEPPFKFRVEYEVTGTTYVNAMGFLGALDDTMCLDMEDLIYDYDGEHKIKIKSIEKLAPDGHVIKKKNVSYSNHGISLWNEDGTPHVVYI